MAFSNRIQTNLARGEISPEAQSRGDIDLFRASLKLCRNFIPKFQGPAEYAPGTTFISASKVTSGSLMIPFVFRDTQSYILEMYIDDSADLNMRILNDNGVVLYAGSDLGWVINDNVGAGTTDSEAIGFQGGLGKDPDFVSAGSAGEEVDVTVTGTFTATDLANVRYAQSGSAMILISEGKFCIQIWRGITSETAWAINEVSVVSSSFAAITSIADDGNGYAEYLTAGVHTLVNGDVVIIKNSDTDNDMDGAFKLTGVVDNTHFTTDQEFLATSTPDFRKGGTFHDFVFAFEEITDFFSAVADIPKEAKFNEGRIYFALDDKLYGSRSVVDGQDMYANMNQSITPIPTDAIEFTVAISADKVDLFKWLKVSNKTFYGGMENLVALIQGSTSDEPIAGDSIRMRSAEDRGCSDVTPIEDGTDIIFVNSTGKTMNAFKFDIVTDGQRSQTLTLLNEHMFDSTIKRIAFQRGLPDIVWVLLESGKLLGFIFNSAENITGWFIYQDGQSDLYNDISVLPINNGVDRMWVNVARSDGSDGTADQLEQLELSTLFAKIEDFYSGSSNKVDDTRRWKNAIFEQQKHAAHMHSMLFADVFTTTLASDRYLHFSEDLTEAFVSSDGTAANKITGASSPLDGEDDEHLVIKATTKGLGEGIYHINDYTSGTGISTLDELKTLADFTFNVAQDSFIIPPGFWGITFSSITSSSLQRYFDSTGKDIDVVLDGGFVDDAVIVKDGSDYTVDFSPKKGTVVYFGYKYRGIIATLPVDIGGFSGTAFSKLKNIEEVRVDFIDTAAIKFGVDLYKLNVQIFRLGSDLTDRPPPLFTGTKELKNVNGGWSNKKSMYFVQDTPVPCTIAGIDISGSASDDI